MQKKSSVESLISFVRQLSVTPADLEEYLKSIESTPLTQGRKLYDIILRNKITLNGLAEYLPELADFIFENGCSPGSDRRSRNPDQISRIHRARKAHRRQNDATRKYPDPTGFQLQRTDFAFDRIPTETDENPPVYHRTGFADTGSQPGRHQRTVGLFRTLIVPRGTNLYLKHPSWRMFHVEQI